MTKAVTGLVSLVALFSCATGVNLGIGFGRDGLYMPDLDSSIIPTVAFASAEFNIGRSLNLGIRGGYSWQRWAKDQYGDFLDYRSAVDGARVEFLPTVQSPLFLNCFRLRAGIGLSAVFYRTELYGFFFDTTDFYSHEGMTDRYVAGATQTFVAGVRFPISDRVEFGLDVERVGYVLSYTITDYLVRHAWSTHWDCNQEQNSFASSWVQHPATAISASVHVRL